MPNIFTKQQHQAIASLEKAMQRCERLGLGAFANAGCQVTLFVFLRDAYATHDIEKSTTAFFESHAYHSNTHFIMDCGDPS